MWRLYLWPRTNLLNFILLYAINGQEPLLVKELRGAPLLVEEVHGAFANGQAPLFLALLYSIVSCSSLLGSTLLNSTYDTLLMAKHPLLVEEVCGASTNGQALIYSTLLCSTLIFSIRGVAKQLS